MTAGSAVRALVVAIAVTLTAGPALAFWNLFDETAEPQPQESEFVSPLDELRLADCANPESRDKYGETEYMRSRRTRFELAPDLRAAMAAAFLAETPDDATALLGPYLTADDLDGRASARIGLAFAHLRKAAGDRAVSAGVMDLISHPDVANRTDAAYIKGALALYERDWPKVRSAASAVLEQEPAHYNANVLRSLALLQSLANDRAATNPSRCGATVAGIIDALRPVMAFGACPTQMAHMDVTAERYLRYRDHASASRQRLLRRLILAYVSRNDTAAMATLAAYRKVYGVELPCDGPVTALGLDPGRR